MKLTNYLCAAAMLCLLSACSTDPINEDETAANYEITVEVDNNIIFAEEVLDILNEHRATLDLAPLKWDIDSEEVATGHSYYMAQNNTPSHDNFFDRADFLKDRGAAIVSENVAYGYTDAQSVVRGWLGSPSHREAIEGNFTHTGIGVIENEQGIPFFTQMFIR